MVAVLADNRPALAQATYHTRRRPERETDGDRIAAVFRELTGFDVMPWQQDLFDLVGERLSDRECRELLVPPGTPAYREIAVGVPRRAAKTTSAFAVCVDQSTRREWWGQTPPNAIYTAQTGSDARKKFLMDFAPLLTGKRASPAIRRRMHRVLKGAGNESAQFRNGAAIYLGNNTEEAGHGFQFDTAILDEAFADTDNRREAALSPGQLTLPWAQRIICSTAGTASSYYWNDKCAAGRNAVEADTGTGLAYVEFSMPPDASIFDEELWWTYHPALGHSIDLPTLRYEIHSLAKSSELEARRAFGNIPTVRVFSQQIPADRWEAVCDPAHSAKGKGPHVWAVDVAEDRGHAAIAVCDTDTNTVALTDRYEGVEWLDARVEERQTEHPGVVVYDATGPAKNIGESHPDWVGLTSPQMAVAYAGTFDHVVAGTCKVRKSADLDRALAAADVRKSSDSKRWSRSMSAGDISPLIALSMALTARPDPPKRSGPMYFSI